MDIDTRSKYLRFAKACADAAVERTTDPQVREMLLKVAADLRAAAPSDRADAAERTTDPKVHEILLKVAAVCFLSAPTPLSRRLIAKSARSFSRCLPI
jgi:hypothetical protein